MNLQTWLLYFVFVSFDNFITEIGGQFNLVIKRLEVCDPKVAYPMKVYASIRTVAGKQYLDGNSTSDVPLDDDVRSNFTVELLVGRKYIQVAKFEEKHTCSSMHRYFGEFAYDLERAAQLVPGLCPIPPGRLHIHNHLLNYDKITLHNFPFGHLRAREIATDKNNNVLLCLVAEAENEPFT